MSMVATFAQHSTEYANRNQIRTKMYPNQKVKSFLFAYYVILYVENPKDFAKIC
jgi:hypothetical protein